MFSRKALATAGAVSAAAAMFFGPVAVASADQSAPLELTPVAADSATGSSGTGSASGSDSGSFSGSSAGSGMLDSGSSALDGGTSAIVNIIDAITGVNDLTQPKPAA
ncbi:hypothetical protein [Nocardia lijiangensis]|uniref:hypothetical protein n=1 Tax=Nocardia lijiangensis TaxID=299618 RepID=UPI00082ABCA0|nr:hypothetical protein [Nocardia lijiangensis]